MTEGDQHGRAIKVKMLLFGPLAEKMGSKEIDVALESGSSTLDLAQRFELSEMMSNGLRVAVDGKIMTNPEIPLHDSAEVAFLPPVSGG
ncbi:MAG: molybdopterin synthase sulfur carrier subunit [Euryarchaeota archaeon]|nr:molybdopterin synthase sulfur carrier subunit [Euryarchaeota archaeon]